LNRPRFPFYELFGTPERVRGLFWAFWFVLPFEFWANYRLGAFTSAGVFASLCLVFYKALTIVIISWLFFGGLSSLLKSFNGRPEIKATASGPAVEVAAVDSPKGAISMWAASLFTLWFAASIIIALSHLGSFLFFDEPAKNYDLIGALYVSTDPGSWCGNLCGNYPKSSIVVPVISLIYAVLAAGAVIWYARRLPNRGRPSKNTVNPSLLGAIAIIWVIQSAYDYLVLDGLGRLSDITGL
jgi:hypothetical protein